MLLSLFLESPYWLRIWSLALVPPDGTICISSKFDHKMVPLALVRDLTIEFVTNLANRISYKFDVEDNNALVETYHVYH